VPFAAGRLQKAGLLSYSRGRLQIRDAQGLVEGVCECLEIIENTFDPIFGRPWLELTRQQDGHEA
jgi:hypothetical protein